MFNSPKTFENVCNLHARIELDLNRYLKCGPYSILPM